MAKDAHAVGGNNNNPRKRKNPTYGPHNVDTWAVSEIDQETFTFLWSIKNYSAFSEEEEVCSPIFRGGPKSNHSWCLEIEPKKKSEDDQLEYVSVYLSLTAFGDKNTSKNRKIKVRYQFSILDADGCPAGIYGSPTNQKGSATDDAKEFTKGDSWGWSKFILSTDLISPSRRLVEDDTLKIHCRIWVEGEPKHEVSTGCADKKGLPEKEMVKRRKERLANDFGKLFKDTVMTDIAVTTTDNSTFRAHKNVLAARSPVFAAMFNTNMKEKKLNTVKISDFEDDIVKAMLEYLYTGETELLHERAPDLLQVAEKYDLAGLKEDCEYTIANKLNVENAAQVLVMAHMYNANLLKQRVIKYINSNKKDVMKTKSFEQMSQSHPKLLLDLLYISQ